MLRKILPLLAAAAVVVFIVSRAQTARADETLKVGTLAPAESPWGQVFKIWAKGVNERTNGAVSLQFFWNGQQGDEGAMVGKMRTGQLDGAAITATGLSMIYKHVLVLQLPGLFTSWDKLDTARAAMRPGFDAEFEKQGFKVLGWGDVGMAHVMTKGFDIKVPADLKHKNTFYLAGDPIESTFYTVIGDVTPKQVSVPEILTGLTSGTINVVNAPALAAEQLQWASRLDHINTAASGIGIGALVFTSAKIKSLPADAATALIETGKVAGDALTGRIRREDAAAFARLKGRMATYDPTPDDMAQWNKVFADTRARLRGTFDPAVFDAAVKYSQ
jgi:TRAP-type C4-dicarboxylate transport system substrate-binding protein